MEFDWSHPPFELDSSLMAHEIEESFEDPFVVRLLPDTNRFSTQARFFNLGRSASGRGYFSLYRTNGKMVRVIAARLFTPEEEIFYSRHMKRHLDL